MSTLSCPVYKGHTDQNTPYWVSIGLITRTSPAITFCQVSLNSMVFHKTTLMDLKKKAPKKHLVNKQFGIHF